MFDLVIIGGGAAGMSCALIIGSALNKPYAKNKKTALIAHQKSSHLQNALFNNVLGLTPGTLGEDILENGKRELNNLYPELTQIEKEKVLEVLEYPNYFEVITNKNNYQAKTVVVAVGYTSPFSIKGLDNYVIPHQMSKPEKNRIQLRNKLQLIKPNLYVAGSLAGWRSQFAIACGSGAQVATDILTKWNNDEHTKVHDKK